MPEIPSPILIFGDAYISKNNIISLKKACKDFIWVAKSATTETINDIRAEAGFSSWDDKEKILLIQDLPNKKQTRDFIIDLASTCQGNVKIVVWDSLGHIKVDPKEKTIEKSWADFVTAFKAIKGCKVVDNGGMLTEKQSDDSVNFVISRFQKYGKTIGTREAKVLIGIVGYDRGMLDSEMKKLLLTCPDPVTSQFIIDNAFPTTKEAVLYKIGNALDEGSFENAVNMVERFLATGTNENQIAELIVKKARWQLAAASLYHAGLDWYSITNRLMEMGKFPSAIWHNEQLDVGMKRKTAEPLQSPESMVDYLIAKEGIPARYFKPVVEKSSPKGKTAMSRKNAEIVPMYFMAEQTTNYLRDRIVRPCKLPPAEIKARLLDRAIKVYLLVQEKLAEIRYGSNPEQDLQEMIKAMSNTKLD